MWPSTAIRRPRAPSRPRCTAGATRPERTGTRAPIGFRFPCPVSLCSGRWVSRLLSRALRWRSGRIAQDRYARASPSANRKVLARFSLMAPVPTVQLKELCMGEPTELHLERVQPTVRRLRVRIAEGPDRERVIEHYGERVGVGTSPANELTLTDPTVSHYHLELRCEDGVVVKDLGSRNGTFIGDLRISEAVVPVGTRLRLGRTVLAVLDATIAPPETPLPPPD